MSSAARLAGIPGVGPIGATLLSIKVIDAGGFRSGRDFAAWLGLTPKNHSTAGKNRLGAITRAGDNMLRTVLVAGATAVIADMRRGGKRSWPVAEGDDRPQASQAGGDRARQQAGTDRLEADGQRRMLSTDCRRTGVSRVCAGMTESKSLAPDRPGLTPEPCRKGTGGVIGASRIGEKLRSVHRQKMPFSCLELTVREAHLGQWSQGPNNRPDI